MAEATLTIRVGAKMRRFWPLSLFGLVVPVLGRISPAATVRAANWLLRFPRLDIYVDGRLQQSLTVADLGFGGFELA